MCRARSPIQREEAALLMRVSLEATSNKILLFSSSRCMRVGACDAWFMADTGGTGSRKQVQRKLLQEGRTSGDLLMDGNGRFMI